MTREAQTHFLSTASLTGVNGINSIVLMDGSHLPKDSVIPIEVPHPASPYFGDRSNMMYCGRAVTEATIMVEACNADREAAHAESAQLVTIRRELNGR